MAKISVGSAGVPISREEVDSMMTEKINRTTQGIREDFIVIFGIFASILIFLGIDIQIFRFATRFSLLIGFSSFLLGSLLTFVLSIVMVIKDKMTYKDLRGNVLLHLIAVLFLVSTICFIWATSIK